MKKCAIKGCTAKATSEWSCCADGNCDTPLCGFHDMVINALFMSVVRPPRWKKKLKAYIDDL